MNQINPDRPGKAVRGFVFSGSCCFPYQQALEHFHLFLQLPRLFKRLVPLALRFGADLDKGAADLIGQPLGIGCRTMAATICYRWRLMIKNLKIVSGGQTGADRAALDWAIEHDVPHGGWCPAGRLAEDGVVPARYALDELLEGGYLERTRANVRDSDATLIISLSPVLSGGSKETSRFAIELHKAWLHVHPSVNWKAALGQWVRPRGEFVLNVAGPRASKEPGVGVFVGEVLDEMFGRQFSD